MPAKSEVPSLQEFAELFEEIRDVIRANVDHIVAYAVPDGHERVRGELKAVLVEGYNGVTDRADMLAVILREAEAVQAAAEKAASKPAPKRASGGKGGTKSSGSKSTKSTTAKRSSGGKGGAKKGGGKTAVPA